MQQFTGLEYIKIDLANRYGLDKETWDVRIHWATEMLKTQESIDDALENADEPYLFLKSLYAHDDALQGKPTGYLSSLDATASFLQIMAALTGCRKTAETCNLINTGKREDAYTMISDAMSIEGVDRSMVKYPIMTH